MFARPLGRSHLTKLKTAESRITASRPEILAEVERSYGDLISPRAEKLAAQGVDDPLASLTRHFTEDIPDVNVGEASAVLRQHKNGRAPRDDSR